mgnify:CR=1 FL=1
MPKPNTNFELGVDDIELIEYALQRQLRVLAERRLTHIQSTVKPEWEISSVKEIDADMKQINNLLGKLYNQKNFYRPKDNYVSG